MNLLRLIITLFLGGAFYVAMAEYPDGHSRWMKRLEKYQQGIKIVITHDTTKYQNFVEGHLDTATFTPETYMAFYSSLRIKPGYI